MVTVMRAVPGLARRTNRCVTCALQLLLPVSVIVRRIADFRTAGASMRAYIASEGILLSLKTSEWSALLVAVAFGGFLTQIF